MYDFQKIVLQRSNKAIKCLNNEMSKFNQIKSNEY